MQGRRPGLAPIPAKEARLSARHVALVYATHRKTGGAERYLNQLARHLASRGERVSIVCRRHEQPPHPDVGFVRLPVPALGNAWRHWAFARAVERHVAGADYDVVVGLGRTWSQDVIRCGGCHATWLEIERRRLLSPLDRLRGKGRLKGRVAAAIEARAFAPGRYRKVLVNSRAIHDDLQRRHAVAPADIEVVPNGVDLDRFHPGLREEAGAALRREWGVSAAAPLLLFLGAGFERKGLGPLLDAMPRLLAKRPDARLVVVGQDRHGARYQARAIALGVGTAVHFIGWRDDPERCFSAADLHVLPTFYDSFAYTVLEALACGTPVVTSQDAGAAELLEAGRHGAVLPSGFTAEALADALVPWCDRDRLEAARRPARALAEEHPVGRSMERAAALILEVAERLAAERAVAPVAPPRAAAGASR